METMRFGKHKGMCVSEVPTDYLEWCYDQIANCPSYVTEELGRRGVMTGDVWLARSRQDRALMTRQEKLIRKLCKTEARKAAFAERQRKAAKEKLAEMQAGINIVGHQYQSLRDEFDRAGGDQDECPFDTDDHKYSGPTMVFMGGKFVVVPSEFPQEIQ